MGGTPQPPITSILFGPAGKAAQLAETTVALLRNKSCIDGHTADRFEQPLERFDNFVSNMPRFDRFVSNA